VARKAGHAGGVISLDPDVISNPMLSVSPRDRNLSDGVSSKKHFVEGSGFDWAFGRYTAMAAAVATPRK
jgi:hypothetical protein